MTLTSTHPDAATTPIPAGAIQVELRDGPTAGQRLVFDHGPITFGRADDNALVVVHPSASRRHGEIRFTDGRWRLIVHGSNKTTLNGRRVSRRPKPLTDQDVVAVDGTAVFGVMLAQPARAAGAADDKTRPTRPRLTRRSKLWLGIGVYLVIMLALFIFLFSLRARNADDVAHAQRLTEVQIIREIRQPLPPQDPYEAQMRLWLERARSLHERLEARPDQLFKTYRAYQRAIALSPEGRLDEGGDLLQFEHVRKLLIERVVRQYRDAYGTLRSHQYEQAYDAFAGVMQTYADDNSVLYRNALKHQSVARRLMDRSKQNRRRGLF